MSHLVPAGMQGTSRTSGQPLAEFGNQCRRASCQATLISLRFFSPWVFFSLILICSPGDWVVGCHSRLQICKFYPQYCGQLARILLSQKIKKTPLWISRQGICAVVRWSENSGQAGGQSTSKHLVPIRCKERVPSLGAVWPASPWDAMSECRAAAKLAFEYVCMPSSIHLSSPGKTCKLLIAS